LLIAANATWRMTTGSVLVYDVKKAASMVPKSTVHIVSRCDFVKAVTMLLGTLMTGILGIPAVSYLISPASAKAEDNAWIPLGPLDSYPIGVPTLFNFTRTRINGWEKTVNSYGAFVLRQDENQGRVFSNICTHLSCRVSWHADLQHYVSPCHDGHFDITGAVLSGPPPRPLDEYPTKIEGGRLFILYPPIERSV
jgi:Rieske Fe-S protein